MTICQFALKDCQQPISHPLKKKTLLNERPNVCGAVLYKAFLLNTLFVHGLPADTMFLLHAYMVRGGIFFYYSVNLRDRFPGPMILDAFCHNKTENNFENFEN